MRWPQFQLEQLSEFRPERLSEFWLEQLSEFQPEQLLEIFSRINYPQFQSYQFWGIIDKSGW